MAIRAFPPMAESVPVCLSACSTGPAGSPLQPVPYARVEIADEFWGPKMEVNRTVSIQHLFRGAGRRATPAS